MIEAILRAYPGAQFDTENGVIVRWVGPGQKPTQAQIAAAILAYEPIAVALEAIRALEAQVTSRRLREAALGDAVAIAFIQSVENQIAALRAQVVP